MDESPKALALELAQDLDSELGGGVVTALRDDNKTRSFGLNEAALMADLILSAIQIAMEYLSDKKTGALDAYLEANLPKPGEVSAAKRADIIRAVLKRFADSGQKA
jgi:hypothetical protein